VQWFHYTPWAIKNVPRNFCQHLHQILTYSKSSLTVTLCEKFATKWLLNIPPRLTTQYGRLETNEHFTEKDSGNRKRRPKVQERQTEARAYCSEHDCCGWAGTKPGRPATMSQTHRSTRQISRETNLTQSIASYGSFTAILKYCFSFTKALVCHYC